MHNGGVTPAERPAPAPSVIIAAHNEEAVIESCLDALQAQEGLQGIEIVVSANGCTDRTSELAARPGVIVIDRPEPGKASALNAGEMAAAWFPRFYLDADITPPKFALASLAALLEGDGGALVAVPRRRLETGGCPLLVRGYFAINERLPAFRSGLFGRGLIGVSVAGRERFAAFPELVADDLFLDSQFADNERAVADDVEVVVHAPRATAALLRRLVRVRRGNAEMREHLRGVARPSDRWAWWREVVAPHPSLIFAAVPYVALTLLADLLARRPSAEAWGQDTSTRSKGAS